MMIDGTRRRTFLALALATTAVGAAGCDRARPQAGDLPPAYTSNQITDPALLDVAGGIQGWGAKEVGADGRPLFGRVEVLRPVPIVQPYGVGVFEQEMRLPVIFTTGPGWPGLKPEEKEAAIVVVYDHISESLKALERDPPLQATLTVQTPQGMEVAWINRLDPNGKNMHGDD